jgi:hypothetical protein
VKFDELNLSDENVDFYDIIKTTLIEKLHELAEPSAMMFLSICLQWISLILLYFLIYNSKLSFVKDIRDFITCLKKPEDKKAGYYISN